nr:EAL domain-containing protein [Butyrivibrio sp.]
YDLMDNNMYRDTHPDDMSSLGDAAYRFATEGGAYDVIYRSKRDGEYRIIHAYGRHIYKEDGTRLALVWYTDQGAFVDDGKNEKDILLNSLKNQLAERSIGIKTGHDYLTGLPSMTYFFELADAGCERIRKSGKTPVILFTDFDGMKVYNQRYGLEEGDRILKSFSEDIIDLFTHENCSRFNADHFCIFTDEEKAYQAVEKLFEKNSRLESEKKMPLRIGMYRYEDQNISISGACDRAKMACDSGKNNYSSKLYLFDQKMMTSVEERHYLIENIDRAVEEGWIKVFYQSVVRTANGQLCHEEALARWNDPERGFISPAVFIPALEESNTIYKLDLFVLDSVLRRMKDQANRGISILPVSVNLSRSDFYTCDIVEEVKKRVDNAGIARDRIVIEITESIVADDLDYMIGEINRFKELGFEVWMDDYGSGYSSPMILQKVPFDVIKIDLLLVRQLEENEKTRIVLTEIVRMAMALGLDTVAEGVETKGQADFLKDIGCTMLQGYYYSKPIPYEEIIEGIKKEKFIGIENSEESDYYIQLGRVNLYNLSFSIRDDEQHVDYFDTWPMVMVECKNGKLNVVRANITFKGYIKENFPDLVGKTEFDIADFAEKTGNRSLNSIMMCAEDGKRVIIDDVAASGKTLQILVWRIAVNPVTKVAAVMVVVLSSTDEHNEKLR